MAKNLVIVESPAKAKTIKKFLGSNYKVEASMGHVRDLPKSEMGVDIDNDFEPKYITIRGKGELLSKLRKEVKAADKVYLATDPDREGEAISWHLVSALRLADKEFYRITFNEITKNAVRKAIKEARSIDMSLVDAQQSRRVLDRILGYQISPLLWKKIKKGLSAGRVQSVALRLICEKEVEINNFIPEEYWTVTAQLKAGQKAAKLEAKLYGRSDGKLEIKSAEEVEAIKKATKRRKAEITEIKDSSRVRKPNPPFTTSTLQQEASRHLNMTSQKTMLVAQQLYEGLDVRGQGSIGLVTYIRTDSMRISDEAYADVTKYIAEKIGGDYVNKQRPEYKSRGRTQDAHEAIRPSYINLVPDDIKDSLSKEQFKLYKLIWERFVASQMSPAVYSTKAIKIKIGDYQFRANGSVLTFNGFLAVYNKKYDNDEDELALPNIAQDDKLSVVSIDGTQHFTQPPSRFSESSLIRTLEELGVGRPSTYAPTITTILLRGYVAKENKLFYSTELGELVNEIVVDYFSDTFDASFTAKMEEDLDMVEEGKIEWKDIIREFYYPFNQKVKVAEEEILKITIEDEVTDVICDKCGKNMVVKYGRYGKFLACPSFPECMNTKPFFEEAGVACHICGGKVLIKKTRKGRRYYGCENNPECAFMTWSKPTGEKCPNCGDSLVEKGTKTKMIACSNSNCAYSRPAEAEAEEADD